MMKDKYVTLEGNKYTVRALVFSENLGSFIVNSSHVVFTYRYRIFS